jgi:calmodulin
MPVPPSPYAGHIEVFRESFRLFDLDGDGTITTDELISTLRRLGQGLSATQAAGIVRQYDLNQDGMIELSEFLAHQLRTLTGQPEALRAAFALDGDGDGLLKPEELEQAMAMLWDDKLDEVQLAELRMEANPDGKQGVPLARLVALLTRNQ